MPFGIGPAILRLTAAPTSRPPSASHAARRGPGAVVPVLLALVAALFVILPAPAQHDGPVTGGRTLPVSAHHSPA